MPPGLRAKDKISTTLYSISDGREIFLSAVTLYELHLGATTSEKKKDNDLPIVTLNKKHFKRIDDLKVLRY